MPAKELDPHGKKAHEAGAKMDANKVPVMRGALEYFPRAIEAIAEVSAFGASKYAWKGWEKVPDGINRYNDAMGRHILAMGRGEVTNDADGGLLHMAQRAWNDLAALELFLRQLEADDE